MENIRASKKLIATIVVFILMISAIMPIVSNAVYEDYQDKITVTSPTGKVGEEVTVDVKAKENIKTFEGTLILQYDESSLDFVKTSVLNEANMSTNDARGEGVVISITSFTAKEVEIPAGATIASVTFRIKQGAATNNLTLIYDDNDAQLTTAKVNVISPATGISIDKQSLDLNIADNRTGDLVATIEPANSTDTISWKSTNTGVATVSGTGANARVTAVAKGKTDIIATAGSKTAVCHVAVSAAPLTSITLSNAPEDVIKGQTFKFEVTPNEGAEIAEGSLTWEANPAEVATVDNDGTVHPLKEGQVTVTAKVKGQENITDSKTFNVREIPLTSIAINTTDFELFLGDSEKLGILLNPENTTDDTSKVKWESDNDAVIVNQDGVVTAVKIGEANITATVNEGEPNEKSATVKITVPEVELEGIQIQSEKSQLKIGETSDVWFDTTPERITDEMEEMKITSSDENIVSVNSDDWTIKGVNPGKATISVYVKTVDGKEFTSSMEIEVLNEVYVPGGSNDASTEETNKGPMPNTGDIAIATFAVLMVVSAAGIAVIKFRKNNSKH